MTRDEKDLLFSLCFGDGCASEKTNGTSKKMYGEFQVAHCDKQLPYLEWKRELVHSIFGGKIPSIGTYHRKRKGVLLHNGYTGTKDTIEHHFSKTHPYFKVIKRMMYKNGKKTFSRAVLNRLSLLGLMIWYLDDGCLAPMIRDGRVRTYHVIITISKPMEQLQEIVKYFKEVWGLNWVINKQGLGWRIRMGKKEGSKFLEMIKPLVEEHVPSMMYKVDLSLNTRVQKLLKEE